MGTDRFLGLDIIFLMRTYGDIRMKEIRERIVLKEVLVNGVGVICR